MSTLPARAGSGRRKAAVALVALGPERGAALLRGMAPDEVFLLAREVANLGPVDTDEVRSTLRELQADLSTPSGNVLPAPGAGFARDLIVRALGEQDGGRLADRIGPPPFGWLAEADPDQAAAGLAQETPATCALALAHLAPRPAAQLLTRLPESLRHRVAMRIAQLGSVHPDTVAEVDRALQERVTALFTATPEPLPGPQLLASMLQFAGRDDEKDVLNLLGQDSPELADAVRNALFTFDDVARLEARALQVLLKAVDTRQLAVALKGAEEPTVSRVLSNLSERGREGLLEEIDLLTSVRAAEISGARQAIVATARKLEDEGAIVIARPDETEGA